MNLTKRVTAWFLILVMVLGLIPQTVFAEEKTASSPQYEILQEINENKTEATISLKFAETETIQLEKVKMPDGTEIIEDLSVVTYTVSKNGTYDFKVNYLADGVEQEEAITVEISGLLEKKFAKETLANAKKDIDSSELKTNGLQVSENSYEVSSADELNTILKKIKNNQDTEAKIVLTADIATETEFAGIEGKNITLQSKGQEKHSFNLSETIQGNVVLDNVKLANDEKDVVYANGNKFETTANFQGIIHNIYGGGNENTAIVRDTYLILRGGTFSSIYGGGCNSTVTGDTHITFDGATIEPGFGPNKKRIVGGGYANKANSGKVDGNTNVEIVSGTLGITTSIKNQDEDNGNGIYAGGYNDKMSDFDSSAVVTGNTNLIFGGKTDGSIVVGNERYGIQDVNYCAGSYRSTILGNASLTLKNGSKMTYVDRFGNTSGPTLYGGGLEDYINGTVQINVSGGKNMQWEESYGDSKGGQGGIQLYLGGKKNINNAINQDGAVIKNTNNKPYAVIFNMSGGSLARVYGKENVTPFYSNSKYEGILGDVKMNISGESTEVAEIYGSYSSSIETSNENSKSEITIENQTKFRSVQDTEKLKLNNIGTMESEVPIKTLQRINHLTIDNSHIYVGYKAWYSEAANKTESMPWVKNLTLNNSVLHTDNNAITTIKNHKNTRALRPDLGASVTMKESSWIADEVIQIYGSMNMENSKLILRSNAIARNVLTTFNVIKEDFHAKKGELYLNTVDPKNGNYDNSVDTDPKKVIRLQINGKATGDCKVFTTKNGQGLTLEKPEINGNYIIANTQSKFDTFQLANEDAVADGLAFVKKYGRIKEATGGSNISKKLATMWQIGNAPVPNYNVTYNFVSGSTGKELPNEIMNLLPIDSTKYVEGNTINAIQPNNTEITVSDGVWKFKGYDANSKIANADNADKNRIIKFTGTWEFKLNEYKIDYRFVSSNKDKELPNEITDKLPAIGSVKYGNTVNAPSTQFNDVVVSDGKWIFKGWAPAKYENVTEDVAFIGTWKFKKNPSVIPDTDTSNKPSDTPKPIIPDTSVKDKVPQTGDSTHINLWGVMMIISGGLSFVVINRKSKS